MQYIIYYIHNTIKIGVHGLFSKFLFFFFFGGSKLIRSLLQAGTIWVVSNSTFTVYLETAYFSETKNFFLKVL